jgi:hypothetical protein
MLHSCSNKRFVILVGFDSLSSYTCSLHSNVNFILLLLSKLYFIIPETHHEEHKICRSNSCFKMNNEI